MPHGWLVVGGGGGGGGGGVMVARCRQALFITTLNLQTAAKFETGRFTLLGQGFVGRFTLLGQGFVGRFTLLGQGFVGRFTLLDCPLFGVSLYLTTNLQSSPSLTSCCNFISDSRYVTNFFLNS